MTSWFWISALLPHAATKSCLTLWNCFFFCEFFRKNFYLLFRKLRHVEICVQKMRSQTIFYTELAQFEFQNLSYNIDISELQTNFSIYSEILYKNWYKFTKKLSSSLKTYIYREFFERWIQKCNQKIAQIKLRRVTRVRKNAKCKNLRIFGLWSYRAKWKNQDFWEKSSDS